ncbi:class I SAM-dependent methyltransferase [Pseudodesulfovibrio piezophilus]|uniref:Methyltransferase type 11 domain-containing protein n=1 Tax=Pseudodesulfovibrio piezophilus (strain DSM 21447 / JCM 15486 / C1TLV30) TaxID=1322246 RepID=M1WMR7_PSEP2|nr:class I SAM-dependent methyltransferase [Pseudodesulfovibrio piezophilus]CCH49915.1 protein of unknown function [Pseudodesulfovibrio piezophilus C1TLV30]
MSSSTKYSGSKNEFRTNWASRKESKYNHWTDGKTTNQIQFAFRNHWEIFSEFMNFSEPGDSLEVGCGRGSLSSYFADNGWRVSLLDSSSEVIEIAKRIFQINGHSGQFFSGDANNLPFESDSFDVVFSIGLLEHFEDASTSLNEQWRVLRPGGWVFSYIVPERPQNVQKYFNWVNILLRKTVGKFLSKKSEISKQDIYRNDYSSDVYLPMIETLNPSKVVVTGMYPMPMISHSPEFPFSLLPSPLERFLVMLFKGAIFLRKIVTGRHGWLCSEPMGQAFLIAVQKGDFGENS